ncbi:MAG: hypothetical protein JWP47_2494 [Polaromonas sp.]|jgi:hypothetical protein|nr:hypothetical protein [Polaromonas sp.]
MPTMHSCPVTISLPFLTAPRFRLETRFSWAAGPGTPDHAEDEGGLLDLPVNPDEGADQLPEEDSPVPS